MDINNLQITRITDSGDRITAALIANGDLIVTISDGSRIIMKNGIFGDAIKTHEILDMRGAVISGFLKVEGLFFVLNYTTPKGDQKNLHWSDPSLGQDFITKVLDSV